VNTWTLPALLVIVPALAAVGCSGGELPPNLPPNIARLVSVSEREGMAPEFSWMGTDGKEVRFDDARGEVTLVNFWATWCSPCKKELPDLVELSGKYADRGFRVIGVATDRTPNAPSLVAEFVGKYSIPYQVVLSSGEMERAFGNVRQMPTSVIVGRDGRVVRTIIGIMSRTEFQKTIEPLL